MVESVKRLRSTVDLDVLYHVTRFNLHAPLVSTRDVHAAPGCGQSHGVARSTVGNLNAALLSDRNHHTVRNTGQTHYWRKVVQEILSQTRDFCTQTVHLKSLNLVVYELQQPVCSGLSSLIDEKSLMSGQNPCSAVLPGLNHGWTW